MASNPKLIDKLSSQLTPDARNLLHTVISCAEKMGTPAFLVGGPVRDLLLDRPVVDLDVAVEGDAIRLAEDVAKDVGGAVVNRSEFRTAAVRVDLATIDLVTARAETYPKPGALPSVRPATIGEDLRRRDFTVNAIALNLGAGEAPPLDPVGGIGDIHSRLVRVLHDQSFQDDPTRILRAVRYETRLGFTIESSTLERLQRDLHYVDAVSGTRIRRELERTFAEQSPGTTLSRMQELSVLAAIHPAIRLDDRQLKSLDVMGPFTPRGYPVAFALLAWHVPGEQITGFAARLATTKPQREAVLAIPAVRDIRQKLVDELEPSAADALLAPYPWPAVLALGTAEDTPASWWAREYIDEMKGVKTILSGDEVQAMGIPRGPQVGEVLSLLRRARLDGAVTTREHEETLVREWIAAASENNHSA
jgi:tRNA nucleotidyltransferase (CCA-adding enzyme)